MLTIMIASYMSSDKDDLKSDKFEKLLSTLT